jgi:hypothetical protein
MHYTGMSKTQRYYDCLLYGRKFTDVIMLVKQPLNAQS